MAGERAEVEPLRADEALALLDRIDDAAFVVDAEFRVRWGNARAAAFFGLSLAQARGQSVLDLFPDTRGGPIEALYRSVLADGARVSEEVDYPRTKQRLSIAVEPFGDGLVAFYRDVTRRHLAERRLRDNARRYRVMAEHVSDVLSVASPEGVCLWISPSVDAALGFRPDELLGRNLRDLIHPDDLAEIDRMAALGTDLFAPMRMTFRQRRKDGSWRYAEATGRLLPGPDGRPSESIFVIRDMSEQQQAREALERALEQAQATARAKTAFLANMSHEIRTPMNGVIGMTSLLLGTRLDDEQRRFVDVIRQSGHSLLAVINDILDFSKVEAGHLALEPTPVDLRRLVEGAADVVTGSVSGRPVELVVDLDPAVPLAIEVDGDRVRQILVNLLGNATKFTERGEVVVRASVVPGAPEGQSQLRFEVRDTGIGIDPAELPRLFQPFTQVDGSRTRRHGGTGLGLSISARLATLLGSELLAESELGKGSRFYFDLTAPVCAPPTHRRAPASPTSIIGLRVVVVDDNQTNREGLERQLRGWRADPVCFARPSEALEWLRSGGEADLALLDMQMPEMDGLELAEAIASLRPSLPLLLLSSLGQRVDARHVFEVLLKPVKQRDLFDAICGAVDGVLGLGVPTPTDLPAVGVGANLEVLLAEDNPVNAMVAELMLQRMNVRVDTVADGLGVLRAFELRPYDVVLMDIHMPELDGLEATKRLRALPLARQPYVVALTANAMQEDRDRAFSAGVDDYVAKPFSPDELVQVFARAYEKRANAEAFARGQSSG